jgi:hypothetical protein
MLAINVKFEDVLKTRMLRAIALQVSAGLTINLNDEIKFVCDLPFIESILFDASLKLTLKVHIIIFMNMINMKLMDKYFQNKIMYLPQIFFL